MKFIELLHETWEMPKPYESFHIIFMVIFLGLSIFFSILFRKNKDKSFKVFLFISWFIIAVLEILKLVLNFTTIEEGKVIVEFEASCLGFQFCSLPLYCLPVVVFAKEGKIKDAFVLFLATYCLAAGIIVFIWPNTLFSGNIFLDFRTLIHHGIQLMTGIVLLVRYFDKFNLKNLLQSSLLFTCFVMLARYLNELFFNTNFKGSADVDFFFISPHHEDIFPVFGNIKQLIPNNLFTLGYILGFSLIALIIFIVPVVITRKWECLKINNVNEENSRN